jgi:hypothetical protein
MKEFQCAFLDVFRPLPRMALLLVLSGCGGDDPNIPHVVYSDSYPPPKPDRVVAVPEWANGSPPLKFSPEPVKPGLRLEFDGSINGPIDKRPGTFMILIEGRDKRGKVSYINNGGTYATRGTGDEPWTYQISLEGPKKPGRYQVRLLASGGEVTPSENPFATADLEVR